MRRPDTPQTLDPLSGLTARTVVFATSIFSLGVTLFSLIRGAGEIVHPSWAVVSIAAVIGAVMGLNLASSPYRAPFGPRSQAVITALLAVVIIAETAASFGANRVILDGYGYLVAALFLFPLGSYRPYPQILVTTVTLAAVQAVAALLQAPYLVAPYPPAVFAIVTVAPVLASGAGAAALSHHLVAAERAQSMASIAADRSGSVMMRPLAIIDDEVLPLLARVSSARAVTADDVAEAAAVGIRMRELLVSESNASVLPAWMGGISDPHGHLGNWTMRQRAAAYAYAAKVIPTVDLPEASLVVGADATWTFSVSRHDGRLPERSVLAPYIATLGVAFDGVEMRRNGDTIVIRGRGPVTG